MYDGIKVKAGDETIYTITKGLVYGDWQYNLSWEGSGGLIRNTGFGYTENQIKDYLEEGSWTVVDDTTHIKIEVVTAEFNYQGLYKGTVIDNAKITPNGVSFQRNGKLWVLDKGSYLTFKDQVEEHAKSESKSALDKQVSGDHYKTCGIQPIEYIHANGLNYFQGNVVKYVTRYKDKAGKADLEKAIHYLELMIELEYKEED